MHPNLKKNKSGIWAFAFALVLSFGIWLTHNLTLEYTDVVSVPVVAVSNIDGRASESSNEVCVVARCTGTGFKLLSLKLSKDDPVKVVFDSRDLVKTGGDSYTIFSESMVRYFPDIFGDKSKLVAFISRSAQFDFPHESYKKVPVKAFCSISCKKQYMALNEIEIVPDSILIYGEPERLAEVDAVLTKQFSLKDLKSDAHGTVEIKNPGGIRLSSDKVDYTLKVGRYVEIKSSANVALYNAPSNISLDIFPRTVDILFRCKFPFSGNPVDRMEFYVDFKDFDNSITGKCAVRWGKLPDGVISCSVSPQVCECVVKEDEQ